jgi:DNA-3-methyladenine glycosylase II
MRGRVQALIGTCTPNNILSRTDEELKRTGLSSSKIKYIKDLSRKVLDKELQFEGLDQLGNNEVMQRLTSVKGIGRWTAEMFLIFTFGKPDVLSLGDAGLQRAAKWLYQIENALEVKGKEWAPYHSIASLYLWEAVDRGYINQFRSIDDLIHANLKE